MLAPSRASVSSKAWTRLLVSRVGSGQNQADLVAEASSGHKADILQPSFYVTA